MWCLIDPPAGYFNFSNKWNIILKGGARVVWWPKIEKIHSRGDANLMRCSFRRLSREWNMIYNLLQLLQRKSQKLTLSHFYAFHEFFPFFLQVRKRSQNLIYIYGLNSKYINIYWKNFTFWSSKCLVKSVFSSSFCRWYASFIHKMKNTIRFRYAFEYHNIWCIWLCTVLWTEKIWLLINQKKVFYENREY